MISFPRLLLALVLVALLPLQAGIAAEPAQPAPEAAAAPVAQPAPAPHPQAGSDFGEAGREMGVDINAKIGEWSGEFDRIDKDLDKNPRYRDLDRYRQRLDDIRGDIDRFLDGLRPKVDAFRAQVDSLGPAPAKDQPPEPEAVAKQRSDWNATLGSLAVAQNAAEAAKLRANQIISKIQDIRRRRFTEQLFERVPEAYSLNAWENAPRQIVYAIGQAGGAVANWWMLQEEPDDVVLLLTIAAAMASALALIGYRGIRRVRVWKGTEQPPFWRRGAGAAWLILMRVLPIAAPVIFLYFSLHGQDLMSADVDRLAYAAMRSTLIITVVVALVTTALSPSFPEWRLIPASDAAARRIRILVTALAAVYALNLLLGTMRSVAFAPFSVQVVQNCVAAVLIALLVMAILRTNLDTTAIEGAPELHWLRALRMPVWAAAIVILLAAVSGYISLARFLSTQLIVTGTILAIVYLMMIWVDAFGQSMSDENAVTGRWLMKTFGCEKRRCEQFALPAKLILKSAVLLLSVPLILLQWGFDAKDIADWSRDLFFGFRIGNTQISVAAILASMIVFTLGYAAARLFQGWLDRQVLQPAGISRSVRDSIRTGVGYIGVIVAALIAISYAGLDLSNVALVAGALSVGVGLGLQGVVNNFVSGLILLVERPIKVGDWVVIGGEEGLVRRISVRSTEIETFERANVLVPNSYLITEKVKNWTLRNYSGRIIIEVGVNYGSDARRVRDLLLEVGRAHPQVMTNPEPSVILNQLGPQALEFKLLVYVYDLTKGGGVQTDLRLNILETFKAAGIAMPNGSKGFNLHAVDGLKRVMQADSTAMLRHKRRRRAYGRLAANGNGHSRPTEPN